MKTITLKKFGKISPINDDSIKMELDSIQMITTVLGQPVANGLDISTIRIHIKILDKLSEAKGRFQTDISYFNLEDEEYNILLNAVQNMKWAFSHKVFIDFTDLIINAQNS